MLQPRCSVVVWQNIDALHLRPFQEIPYYREEFLIFLFFEINQILTAFLSNTQFKLSISMIAPLSFSCQLNIL